MLNKAQLKYYRAASWTSEAELQAFADDVQPLSAADVQRLLEPLLDRTLRSDPAHRLRCEAFERLAAPVNDRELFVRYAVALRDGDDLLRATVASLMPRVNHVAGHTALAQVLGSPDEGARRHAAKLLDQLGGAPALNALTQLARVEGYAGRAEAMDVMVPKGRHHALPLLEAVAQCGNARERARAIRWLGDASLFPDKTHRRQAAGLVAHCLNDPHERVVAEAARALAQLVGEGTFYQYAGPLEGSPSATVRRAYVQSLAAYRTRATFNHLGRILRTQTDDLRIAAIDALEAMAVDDILPLLVEALSDPRQVVRNRAVEAVRHVARDSNIDIARTVLWLLKSHDVNVRRMAAELASEIKGSTDSLIPRLLRHLRDEDWWVRERVTDALVELAGKSLTKHVLVYLRDDADVVRRYAVGALRRVKDPRSLEPLMHVALNDPDWWTREDAVATIAELGDPRAIPFIFDVLAKDAELRFACVQALREVRATEAAPQIVLLLDDERAEVRRAAVEFFYALDLRQYIDALVPLSADPEPSVRDAVARLVADWNITTNQAEQAASLTLLERLLVRVQETHADDLILSSGQRPYIKRQGRIYPIADAALAHDDLVRMIYATLDPAQRASLDARVEVDYSHQVKSHGLRFRGNVFRQLTGLAAVYRIVRSGALALDELGVPESVKGFAHLRNGLVLVGGPTGSGKSTTLAALIDHINRNTSRHIVTLEDPIETVHVCQRSLVNQREIGTDTASFPTALRSTLRQDPDVILVGEMRDLDTIGFAVAAAETGHLVFGTVHTVSVDTTVDRLLGVFPPGKRPQIRSMLSETLRAIICQHLLRAKEPTDPRVLAVEVLINDDAVANLIRKDKCFQLPTVLTTARDKGMQSMDQHLVDLVRAGRVSPDEAYMKANDKNQFSSLLEGSAQPGADSGQRSGAHRTPNPTPDARA
ncbi:MAG: PilT/PilU family type 4a pilus ATPase [Myxococcales bacterium]|nr:PilT/PilU family type 4a pilus ATPase [Myxococcales bacterium]